VDVDDGWGSTVDLKRGGSFDYDVIVVGTFWRTYTRTPSRPPGGDPASPPRQERQGPGEGGSDDRVPGI